MMNKIAIIFCALVGLILLPLFPNVAYAGFGFGLPDVIKERVEELDKKVEQPPTISSLAPKPTTVSPGSDSTITCTASDPNGNPLIYTWDATGGTIPGTGHQVTWTSPQTEGTYTITCTVSDGKGGTDKKTVDVNVVIPDQSPTVSITNPDDGSTVSGTSNVTADADDDNGVSKVEFYIDGTLKSTDTSFPYSWSWDTTQESNGSHEIKVIAYDTINRTAADTHTVTVDNVTEDTTPPTGFDLVSPSNNSQTDNALPTFTWQAGSDPETGIAGYELWIDGAKVKEVAGGTSAAPDQALSVGRHTWYVVAMNGAGLTTSSDSFTLEIITNERPKINLEVSPQEAGIVTLSTSSYKKGDKITLTATPESGWAFHHWEGDASGGADSSTLVAHAHLPSIVADISKDYDKEQTFILDGTSSAGLNAKSRSSYG